MSQILRVEELQIVLKKEKKQIVKRVSFTINSGETLVLLGESGSGKSMTCHSIMGLLDEEKFFVNGRIQYKSTDILSANKNTKQQLFGGEIAFVPQNPMTALDPSMRIRNQMDETLQVHYKLNKSQRKERIIDALNRAGLDNADCVLHSYPYTLSGGMLQRVIIAMALMVDAKLIIADEPTTALDVVHRNETIDEFRKLRKAGVSVFMVTHDFAAASKLGGKLCVMREGEFIETGDFESIINCPKHQYTKALITASSLSSVRQKEGA